MNDFHFLFILEKLLDFRDPSHTVEEQLNTGSLELDDLNQT